jgi:hypothetical protein
LIHARKEAGVFIIEQPEQRRLSCQDSITQAPAAKARAQAAVLVSAVRPTKAIQIRFNHKVPNATVSGRSAGETDSAMGDEIARDADLETEAIRKDNGMPQGVIIKCSFP